MAEVADAGRYRLLEHTADAGVEAEGPTLEAVFAAAARGMFAWVVDPGRVQPRQAWPVQAEAPDLPLLLHAFLEELLYLHLTRRVLPCAFADVRVEPPAADRPGRVTATARGEPVDPGRHALRVEIKAVTLHGLRVQPHAGGWRAVVIVDL